MSKVTGFLLCALLAFVSGAVTPADAPAQDLPGSITLPYDASLQEGPSDDALSLGMALTGSVVSLTGAPVNNYYPVEVGGIAGWIRGDALALNEVPIEAEEGEAAAATPVSTEAAPAGDMVADVPVETAPPEEAPTLADPAPDAAEAPAPAPETVANAPSVTAPDSGPTGPAEVTRRADIFAGPGPDYGVLGTARAGSLVEQTGHQVAGYVTVRASGVTGWVSLDLLGPAPEAASS